ncbi:MAG: hypothetical protein Q9223_007671 [Gallowayella weberi]
MVLITYLAAVAVTIAPALARGGLAPRGSPGPSPTYAYGYGYGYGSSFDSAIEEALNYPEPTAAPKLSDRAKDDAALNADRLTVRITNGFGEDLSISYNSNAGSPSIIGNPPAGTFKAAANTDVVVPRGFAGPIFIGHYFDPANSKIEVAFVSNQDYRPGLDVSYVDGYSVPIVCSCAGVAVTGCNEPLFRLGHTCTNPGPGYRQLCHNPQINSPNGPADPFFQPCQGAAYTFPNDQTANAFGKCDNGDIQCCVGVNCPRPSLQHGKRSLEEYGFGNETEIPLGLA